MTEWTEELLISIAADRYIYKTPTLAYQETIDKTLFSVKIRRSRSQPQHADEKPDQSLRQPSFSGE